MLPHCPRESKSGIPAAVFVSDPKLCETEAHGYGNEQRPSIDDKEGCHSHQARTSPIAVYAPAVMQKVAKYRTLFKDTVSSNLIGACQSDKIRR